MFSSFLLLLLLSSMDVQVVESSVTSLATLELISTREIDVNWKTFFPPVLTEMDEDYLAALATQRIPVDRVKECREAARMVVLRNLNTQKAALLADLERKRKRPILSLGAVPMFPPPPQQQQQWVSSSSSLSEVDTTQPLMNLTAEEVMPADGQPQVGFAPFFSNQSQPTPHIRLPWKPFLNLIYCHGDIS